MEDEHRRVIQNHFSSLVERTDLDLMVTSLYEKGVFSDRMIEPYRDTSRDARMRKRDLYMDITRRGPDAFQNLLNSLSELGYWDLARCLDPNSPYHPRPPIGHNPELRQMNDRYVSISDERKKKEFPQSQPKPEPAVSLITTEPPVETPDITVVKSTQFYEDKDSELGVYAARRRKRGVLLVFNYVQYRAGVDDERRGADVDCRNLTHVFGEIGFSPRVFTNLTKKETMDKCRNLKESLVDYECVFVVVSSHGYELPHSSDTEFRCSDGELIPCRSFIREFNNTNLPQLKGIPKVFIFQICRGSLDDYVPSSLADGTQADAGRSGGEEDAARWPAPPADAARAAADRTYSDILIAHSTLPGYVSHRDKTLGSWYIQALCPVFAARAHDTHVHELLAHVDADLRRRFPHQTSSVDSWGFNRRLYLHPGLFED